MSQKPPHINPEFRQAEAKILPAREYVEGILRGDRYLLSRAITIIESRAAKYRELALEILDACIPHAGRSIRIGITGVPGVGKSTFIEKMGQLVIKAGHRLAVLAIDPSSSISKGAILGDKTRMESLSSQSAAFIRPSATGHSLGGVARKTRESMILCEAAGFDVIFVETVGVGQSETAVSEMVDFFLLLVLAGAGDELQGIKRGIMELADAIVINKADGQNLEAAQRAQAEYQRALHLFPPKESGWQVPVLTASALTGLNLDTIWKKIEEFRALTLQNGYWQRHRQEQMRQWLHHAFEESVYQSIFEDKNLKEKMETLEKKVAEGQISPPRAAALLFEEWKSGFNL